jgi:hypothetical protein
MFVVINLDSIIGIGIKRNFNLKSYVNICIGIKSGAISLFKDEISGNMYWEKTIN